LKGRRLPKLSAVLANPKTVWTRVVVSQWYNAHQRKLLCATGTAVWYHAGIPPVPIRWVLVRDPSGEHDPQAFLSTDLDASPATILGWFVSRWRVETTFQEVRSNLGVETQRQWSDLAILRTTPALLGLFSMITVWADDLANNAAEMLRPNVAAWYRKQEPTFSDAIAAVRRALWCPPDFSMSRQGSDTVIMPSSSRDGMSMPMSADRIPGRRDCGSVRSHGRPLRWVLWYPHARQRAGGGALPVWAGAGGGGHVRFDGCRG